MLDQLTDTSIIMALGGFFIGVLAGLSGKSAVAEVAIDISMLAACSFILLSICKVWV